MFSVIYRFSVIPGREYDFEESWAKLTEMLIEFEGGLGSCLHKSNEPDVYIAYARWQDRGSWERPKNNLPAEAEEYRKAMRKSCEEISTIYELEILDDRLIRK